VLREAGAQLPTFTVALDSYQQKTGERRREKSNFFENYLVTPFSVSLVSLESRCSVTVKVVV
jgi:hypothetical protein